MNFSLLSAPPSIVLSRRPWLCALLLALVGCASRPPGAARRDAPLVAERKWLQSWFRGTPVLISQAGEGPVIVEVPREFCFDRGSARIKPPLAAVLDKLAESLRRTPEAALDLIASPGDSENRTPLSLQRASAVRAALAARGVGARQLVQPTATAMPAVQLRMSLGAR